MTKQEAEKLVLEKLDELSKQRKLLSFAETYNIGYGYLKSYKSREKDRNINLTRKLLEIFLDKEVELVQEIKFIIKEEK